MEEAISILPITAMLNYVTEADARTYHMRKAIYAIRSRKTLLTFVGTLTINGITDTMAGYYICTASNSLGDSATVNIRVWVLFAPYITNFVDAVMVSDQLEYYSLPCDVNAYPAATFEWSVPDTSSVDVFE